MREPHLPRRKVSRGLLLRADVVRDRRDQRDPVDVRVQAGGARGEPLAVVGLVPVREDVEGVQVGDAQAGADDEAAASEKSVQKLVVGRGVSIYCSI